REARQRHGEDAQRLRWVQADLLDPDSLAAAGIDDASFNGVLEHTCFCAIEPEARQTYLRTVKRLLAPDGWLLGLFWCHGREGGPPFGSDPIRLAADLEGSGLIQELWQDAADSALSRDGSPRDGEWLGLWRLPRELPRETERPPLVATSLQPAVALTIGGSDSGGGAGIQADLKTFAALQVHGCSALSCITAQNTLGVDRVDALPPAALKAQVEAVCRDLPVTALKTGMLLNRELIETTAAAIAPLPAARVIDPVMVSRAGAVLLDPEAIEALRSRLLPLASLITPNRHEARLLSGVEISDPAGMDRAARLLAERGP
ncbi:MAG: bifunctional hydroxymethylpyrimidine kinase/phosphomethylpyrimidine kinase, partial [Cyanobacteriota bacterium]